MSIRPRRLRQVVLLVPAKRQARRDGLIGISTDGRQVIFSAQTMRFLDELSGLTAFLDVHGCGRQPMLEYVAKSQQLDIAHPAPPAPLAAFGLSERIYDDAAVKREANKQLNSMIAFALGHELGHIDQRSVGVATGSANVRFEQDADRFALDALARMHVFPVGALTFFQATSLIEGYPETHPLSGNRLRAIAADLARRPAAFVDPSADPDRYAPIIKRFGEQFGRLATQVDRPAMRAAMVITARDKPWSAFREVGATCSRRPDW